MKQVGMLAKLQQPWLRWAGRGFWAVTDQALFAGTNFLVSILLARWLEPAAYGAFSVAFAVFLLLGTLHTALWTEPMMVYGSGRFREAFVAYQQVLLGYHWRFGVLSAVAFLLLGLGFWVYGEREVGLSFFGLALAAPTVLYLWLVRRGVYVLLEPRLAAFGGGLYLVLYLGLALLLLRLGLLNEATAFVAMAVAGLFSAETIRMRLKVGTNRTVDTWEVRKLHWSYGRWALLAGAFSWVPGNIYYLALPAFHGLEATAHFKALMNLLMPVLHFNGALGQLLIPGMVQAEARGLLSAFFKKAMVTLCLPSVLYLVLMTVKGDLVLKVVYAGKYSQDNELLYLLGLIPLAAAAAIVGGSALRAKEKPDIVTKSYAIAAAASATLGVVCALWGGLPGAILGVLLGYTASALGLLKEAVKFVGIALWRKV